MTIRNGCSVEIQARVYPHVDVPQEFRAVHPPAQTLKPGASTDYPRPADNVTVMYGLTGGMTGVKLLSVDRTEGRVVVINGADCTALGSGTTSDF